MTTRLIDLEIRITTPWGRGGRSLEYVLHSPSGAVDFYHATISGKTVYSPEDFQKKLFQQIEELHQRRDVEGKGVVKAEVFRELTTIGHDLYQQLFSPEMRSLYREFRDRVKTLLIVSDEPWIPWEILRPYEFDDDDFFCMKFQMSRWLAGETPLVSEKRIRRLVCIKPGDDEVVKDVEEEVQRLKKLVEETPGLDGLFPPQATAREVEELLERESFDLLHFVGHGEYDEKRPGEAKILLADRSFRVRQVPPAAEKKLRKERPVIFLNACQIARSDRSLTDLDGWAPRWVGRYGGSAFLAPFWSVNSVRACRFAQAFYEEIQEGRTLGEAVVSARHKLREEDPDEMAWLAYSLYGNPNARIVFGDRQPIQKESPVSVVEKLSPLIYPELQWRVDRSPPGALLRAEYGVVPFHFRQREVEDLEAWCRSEADLGVRLYTGAGGMGKTRLALEICTKLRDEGWQTGLVDVERPPEETWKILCEIGAPRLLIVDYAETRRPLLVPLLREIYRSDDKNPTRVLLLARAALDWWEQLKSEGDGVGELLSGPATRWHTLQPLALSSDDRLDSYKIAAQAFSDELGKGMIEDAPENLAAEHYQRALILHMSALAAIDGVRLKHEDGEDGILDYILDRERRFWQKLAVEWELTPEVATGIGRAMAAITLGGGVDGLEYAVLAMRGLAFFKDEEEGILRSVARLLREIYPGTSRWIEPVMPDLLGEHLIMREMEKDSTELLDLVLGPGVE